MRCFINQSEVPIHYEAVYTPPYNGYRKSHYVLCNISDDGKLQIEVEYDQQVNSALVRPLSAGVVCNVEGNKVACTIVQPCNLSIEINDSTEESLFVFANAVREESFEGFEHVICFDEPEYDIDELRITEDNTLVYLADGTVVNGRIVAHDVKNLKICGTGIVTMKKYIRSLPEEMTRCVDICGCQNVALSGICVFDSCNWTVRINGCDNVEICNLKIIGCRGNSDGIDVCGSRNVHVTDCFIRTYDDCFCVKAFDTGNVENVLFEHSVLWNDMSHPMEVGVELRCEEVKNVVFRDIDVIHSLTCYPIFGIHHGDRAQVSDIYFENIRIENAPGVQLFDFRITDSVWNQDTQKGNIKNLYINDIFLVGQEGRDVRCLNARIEGFSEISDISNVHIGNIEAFGKKVRSREFLGLEVLGNVSNIIFEEEEAQSMVESRVVLEDEFVLGEDGYFHGSVKLTVTNHKNGTASGNVGLHVFPKNKSDANEQIYAYDLQAGESTQWICKIRTTPGKLAIESFSDRIDFQPDVLYVPIAYPLTDSIENAAIMEFNTYYGDVDGEVRFALRNGWLEIQSELLKKYEFRLYVVRLFEPGDNEVMFSVEESYFGEAPNLKLKGGEIVRAPELGNHFEITYVFLNQPKVEGVLKGRQISRNLEGVIRMPLSGLRIGENPKDLWMEVELKKPTDYEKPYTLFRSTLPEQTAHMFGHFVVV